MFTVEALDTEGTMPPGLASVIVRIIVGLEIFVAYQVYQASLNEIVLSIKCLL